MSRIPSWLPVLLAGIVLGWGLAHLTPPALHAGGDSDKPPASSETNPNERTLDANLYMQTSAEYRACCLQVYNWGTERLDTLLARHKDDRFKPAVIMDLDETVLDNAGFQSFLDREKLQYKEELWQLWEEKYPKAVALVPGAKAFIEHAESKGVRVVYISGRLDRLRASTIQALQHLGINTQSIDERLLLKEDTSNKSPRREKVQLEYRVLLYFGDNLRDFSDVFAFPKLKNPDDVNEQLAAIRKRKDLVDEAANHWGVDWLVLPNPTYGEWKNPPFDAKGRALLRPSAMKKP
jgi:acid phosphatase